MNDIGIEWLGDRALLLRLGAGIDAALNARVHAVARALRAAKLPGVLDIVPAYASVAVHYDPRAWTDKNSRLPAGERLAHRVLEIADSPDRCTVGSENWMKQRCSEQARQGDDRPLTPPFLPRESAAETESICEIPVCYGGECGPDLADVARYANLDEAEVIARHVAGDYRVAMLGFAPGFPYLLGLDPALHAPRRANPRTQVAAGSVAIGGAQTGIYPRELPGGWQIIGRTPLTLFDPARDPPALLAPGQRVRFRSISASAHERESPKAAFPSRIVQQRQSCVSVLSPGLLSSVQDGGREGRGAIGVGRAGAMDEVSLRLANLLVGNARDATALEITLRGPRLRFETDALIALAGADIDASCDGESVPRWRPLLLRAGSELNLGGMRRGARAYLALAGGIALPAILGSRSTDVNAALGPIPRALAAGDELPCATAPRSLCCDLWQAFDASAANGHSRQRNVFPAKWGLDPAPWFDAAAARPIRAIAGTHFDRLDGDSRCALFGSEFRIGIDSNRVGCRLEGVPLRLAASLELVSAGTAPGTVQLPPGGVPIALTAEGPPTGGYPRVAQIIAIDLPHLAQRRPGDRVRFAQTDLADAQMRYLEQECALAKLESWVRARLRQPW